MSRRKANQKAADAPGNQIRLRGVRQNNLKNFDLNLPLRQLIVVTGPSGSGKSSLAFETLFAEGQRRYVETFSPYARQFFDRMDKPRVDEIQGIPPAVAIQQRNTVKTTRSTVGTMTEVCDYLKVLWPHVARLYCRQCGQPVRQESPQQIWQTLLQRAPAAPEVLVVFDLPLSEKLSLAESLQLIIRQGYQRLLVAGQVVRLDDAEAALASQPPRQLSVVQDRLKITTANRARLVEACEQAYHFGKGHLAIHHPEPEVGWTPQRFSRHLHCATCNLEYREPSAAQFSFNHPQGACPACRGFGRTIDIDYRLVLPNHDLTLAEGVVRPWQSGVSAECQEDMLTYCRKRKVPTQVPFKDLSETHRRWVIEGDPGYGQDEAHQWPHAWYGIKGYFRWLESKTYKMHVRVLLSRYRSYRTCPQCDGKRFQPDSLLYRTEGLTPAATPQLSLADFYALPIRDALRVAEGWPARLAVRPHDPLALVLREVTARLRCLVEIGLGYLTLERPTRTLSGGETERVNLTSCLGTKLVNTLYILDEPSVGLHPRDTARLVTLLKQLRDLGNTVVVVEHEALIIRQADYLVDLGPGAGEAGGHLVAEGRFEELQDKASLTIDYLTGRRSIPLPVRRPVGPEGHWLRLVEVTRHNLRQLTVEIPLGRLVCITGVSGSGKTTLVRECLLPALHARLAAQAKIAASSGDEDEPGEAEAEATGAETFRLEGATWLGGAMLVDQSPLGKTPRSNPAVYLGAFEHIREVFALAPAARQMGLKASAFSFNSGQGQCERCRGAGFEKIEMQFLSDVFIRCPDCNGRRYRQDILVVKAVCPDQDEAAAWSIGDVLEASVNEVIPWLERFAGVKAAGHALARLEILRDVGLGYLRLGQPINTLSGGECQRLKLASHLAENTAQRSAKTPATAEGSRWLFLFDEPTTGLHFEDVSVILRVFQNLVNQGHSVVVIEHNLEVIKCADWVIDLGPEAGDQGGELVVAGPPETVAGCAASHTGTALREAGLK
jgi:excinuclease ABC subunit A